MDTGRLMGLDIGERRIGIAFSDLLGLTAQARGVLERTTPAADVAALVSMAAEEQAQGLVVGLPRRTGGEEGPEAQRVRDFAAQLQTASGLPVFFVDERFSTVMAESVLLAAGMRRDKRKQKVDQVAAAIILQGYLDKQRRLQNTGNCTK